MKTLREIPTGLRRLATAVLCLAVLIMFTRAAALQSAWRTARQRTTLGEVTKTPPQTQTAVKPLVSTIATTPPPPIVAIPQSVIAGGGGQSNSGNFELSGTIGQSALGSTAAGNFGLLGGFWSGELQGPNLILTKSDSGASSAPGGTVIYTLSYANAGTKDAAGVVLTETVPAHTTFNAGASTGGWACAPTNNAGSTCTLTVGSLSSGGGSGSATFAVTVESPLAAGVDQISNSASIADDGTNGGDLLPADNIGSDTTPVNAQPELALTKSDNNANAPLGGTVAYTLSYANAGNQNATGVVLTETIPANTTFNAAASTAGWNCSPDNNAGATCTLAIGNLASGGNGTANFVLNIPGSVPMGVTQISNTATIADDATNGADPLPGNNSGSDTTPIIAYATISQSFNPAQIPTGTTSTLTLTLSNSNGIPLTNAAFSDTLTNLSAAGGAVSGTCSGITPGALAPGATALSFSGITLPANSSCTVSFTVTSSVVGVQTNTTSGISTAQTSTGSGSNPATLTVVGPPVVAKSFTPTAIPLNAPGNVSTMTFTLTNVNTTVTLTGVGFSDTFPAGLQIAATPNVSNSCGGTLTPTPVAGGTSLNLSGGTIGTGINQTCTISVAVTGTTAGNKANKATNVVSTEGGAGLDSVPATLTVIAPPAIAKAFTPNGVPIGQTSTLTFTLSNSADNTVALTGVDFTDVFPGAGALVVATPLVTTNTCGGSLLDSAGGALNAGDVGVKLVGGTISTSPPRLCTVSVNVTPLALGPFVNVTSTVASTNGGTGNFATATLITNLPPVVNAVTPLTQALGSLPTAKLLATVSDDLTPLTSLTASINDSASATINGVTISGLTITANGQLQGQVTTTCSATNATFTLKVTDGAGSTTTVPLALTVISNPGPVLSYNMPPTIVTGQALTVSPATGPSDNGSISNIRLLSVTPSFNGSIAVNAMSGVVTVTNAAAAGSYNLIIRATDQCGVTTDTNFILNVNCVAITLTQTSLPGALAGLPYNQNVTASPTGTYQYTVSNGNLPPGLTLNSNTGAIAGLATTPGTYNFTIKAAAGTCFGLRSYSIVVTCPTITINPASLPNAALGASYNQTLSATPASTYTFTRTSGSLPNGLSLSTAGKITGVPTATGTYTFTVGAQAFGTCQGTRTYTLTVTGSCPTITLPALPNGTLNGSYFGDLSGTTPTGSYTFTLLSGILPPGTVLDNLFGALVGTPTVMGTFNFTLQATSSTNCTGSQAYSVTIGGSPTALAQSADYDGDGKTDLALWRASTGVWDMLMSAQPGSSTQIWGGEGDWTVLGDYDGDGKTDIAIFRPGNGTFYIQRSRDNSYLIKQWGQATDIPVPGDYDGDGKTDIAVWRGSNGTWYILRSSDQRAQVVLWGASTAPFFDVPVPGDYDGDGKTDLAVFRRQNGTWFIQRSRDGEPVVKVWGFGTDVPVARDYDGDRQTDIAVWRGASGQWFVLSSKDGTSQVNAWGSTATGDVPVPGDYDGDGQADLAVWRSGAGQWYMRLSRDQTTRTPLQGQNGDRPVAARFIP